MSWNCSLYSVGLLKRLSLLCVFVLDISVLRWQCALSAVTCTDALIFRVLFMILIGDYYLCS